MKNIIVVILCLTSLMIISSGHIDAAIDPESIVGIWLLDEGSGTDIKDTSGNGNDGKIINAKWTDGKIGKGLEFDGTSRVEIPPSETIDDYLDGFTYLLWTKPTAPPLGSNIRLIERDWHNPTIQIGPTDFYGSIAVNADQGATHVRGGTWEQDEWSFVAITHDGDVLKLYVDNELVADKAVGKADTTLNAGIRFAAYTRAGWDFTGVLDEVAVFNAPLSHNDIKHIMDNGLEEAAAVSSIGKLVSIWARIKEMR